MVERMNLKDMNRGWFIGDFKPSILKTGLFEVGYKKYKTGDKEEKHIHRIAIEYTVVTKGIVEMNGIQYHEGDIVIVPTNQATTFKSITDSETLVVKVPSIPNDKYIIKE
jgi:quercetin dioxygenase-like cupin family protein